MMLRILCSSLDVLALAADPPPSLLPTVAIRGSQVRRARRAVPKDWPIARARGGRPGLRRLDPAGQTPSGPGVAACELGLAPENLDEYRTRIDGNARRNGRPGGKLARNEVVKEPEGDGSRSVWEFRPEAGGFWRERERPDRREPADVHIHAQRRRCDLCQGPARLRRPDRRGTEFSPPNTGADLLDRSRRTAGSSASSSSRSTCPAAGARARAQRGRPLLRQRPGARHLVRQRPGPGACPPRRSTSSELARNVPDQLRQVEPNCEVLVVQGRHARQGRDVLETVVRTRRGPFSMTVLERRFRGERFDYEVKYTVESKRFDELAPTFRKSLDSFREAPGDVPSAEPRRRREPAIVCSTLEDPARP